MTGSTPRREPPVSALPRASGREGESTFRIDLRTYYYLRNAVSGLRLPHLPLRWKARTGLRLALQAGLLLTDRRFAAPTRRLLAKAFGDGWSGRLGPAPDSIATPRQ